MLVNPTTKPASANLVIKLAKLSCLGVISQKANAPGLRTLKHSLRIGTSGRTSQDFPIKPLLLLLNTPSSTVGAEPFLPNLSLIESNWYGGSVTRRSIVSSSRFFKPSKQSSL